MTALPKIIARYPDRVLRERSAEVTEFGPELEELCQRMLATLVASRGIGLAAVQVGVLLRVVVVANTHADLHYSWPHRFLVNPVVTPVGEETADMDEACLSVPGFHDVVRRPSRVIVKWQDPEGNLHEEEWEGLLATVVQHEADHLDGILFPDRLARAGRKRATRAGVATVVT